jgi:hypothetical protein
MSNTDYKNQKKKFALYIIVTFVVGVVLIYIDLKNRLPTEGNGVVIEPKLFDAKLIAGIVLIGASILFTVFWVDKKFKSSQK